MVKVWKQHGGSCCVALKFVYLLILPVALAKCSGCSDGKLARVERELRKYVDDLVVTDKFSVLPGVRIERSVPTENATTYEDASEVSRSGKSFDEYIQNKLTQFYDTHLVSVNVPETARFFFKGDVVKSNDKPVDTGKSSFMAGFGMGFLAFALKKLLLPVFIGAQLIKSVLIAMFLPSIIGSLGKLVGKGLSTFSGVSGASAGAGQNQVEDFEFKDTSPYDNEEQIYPPPEHNLGAGTLDPAPAATSQTETTNSRIGFGNKRVSYVSNHISDNYYLRQPNTKTDYKVFHKIPSSSLLLTSYDPFYSPLLSRVDAVFQQFGLVDGKSPETERCRERLVCLMYANPAKYAPYSNLVSAQLSRELNELRKPASDNPEILRFFRYMKAAKDGQDGEECTAHLGCPSLASKQPSPAMLTTFNDINKLVQARKFQQ